MRTRARRPVRRRTSPSGDAARHNRAGAFARLFEAVREGVFIGSVPVGPEAGGATVAANPYLKSMFGYPANAPEGSVTPFDPDRFADPAARTSFLGRLQSEGAVDDYLLRMRRLDGSPVWVEVTARADADGAGLPFRFLRSRSARGARAPRSSSSTRCRSRRSSRASTASSG